MRVEPEPRRTVVGRAVAPRAWQLLELLIAATMGLIALKLAVG